MSSTAAVILANGCEEIEAVTPIDLLRRAGVEVRVLGLGGLEITGARGIHLRADALLESYTETPDALILPGGLPGAEHLGASAAARTLTERVHAAGGTVAAICAAPALTLAPWGLLAGRNATCYPGFEKHFPAEAKFLEEPVVVDGPVITSRGAGTTLPFALALVERLVNRTAAEQLRTGMLIA